MSEFWKHEIPLPPPTEQNRIVDLLDQADSLRQLRNTITERTAGLVPSLFDKMFGDPATNPKGWAQRPAGKLMEACDYGTSKKADDAGRGITVLRMGNVTISGELDLDNLKAVELEGEELTRQRLQAGDVLFNRTNSRKLVGKTGMWDGRIEAVAASYFIRVRFQDGIEHPQHFTTYMNMPFMKQQLAEMARGAIGQANINSTELKSILVPVPPFPLQKAFANRVSEIRKIGAVQVQSQERLDNLYKAMTHQAFSGKLTADWRKGRMKELLQEMEIQARELNLDTAQLQLAR